MVPVFAGQINRAEKASIGDLFIDVASRTEIEGRIQRLLSASAVQHTEIFPAKAGREREASSDLPCVLDKETCFVVVEMAGEARWTKRRVNLLARKMSLRINSDGVEPKHT